MVCIPLLSADSCQFVHLDSCACQDLQNNRPIPVLFQKLDVFPTVAEAWENCFGPLSSCIVLILFYFLTMLVFELCSKDWV